MKTQGQRSATEKKVTQEVKQLPVIDFDPVTLYLQELEVSIFMTDLFLMIIMKITAFTTHLFQRVHSAVLLQGEWDKVVEL